MLPPAGDEHEDLFINFAVVLSDELRQVLRRAAAS
jgi:hypothetical protein